MELVNASCIILEIARDLKMVFFFPPRLSAPFSTLSAHFESLLYDFDYDVVQISFYPLKILTSQ